ncbi:WXG100 family type VII secretion target [Streptomyces armeniacus]|uniref:WXG100 family type VII secretion target n=1 Tax=Streptomyces armeniacus TaxID=83291 RepID=A0A345XUT8_9ACTN|nr:WXG100 family type VII secretion target [Streptomyces armeniacus]AXK35404.1 WXG100 family type VII secretion target [Streptomyces armeniacus]
MANLQFDDQQLQALITDVQKMQQTLKSKISNLNAVVDAIEAAWQGEAHKSFDQTQRKANEYARSLDAKLQMMEEALQAAKGGFTREEVDQMENFKKIENQSPISDFSGVNTTPTAR